MEIKLGKDIRSYKAKEIGPFTIPQALGFAAGVLCGYIGWALIKEPGILFSLPGFAFGFVKIHGMSLMQYIKIVFPEKMSPRIKHYKSDAVYYLEDIAPEGMADEYRKMIQSEGEKSKEKKYTREEKKLLNTELRAYK